MFSGISQTSCDSLTFDHQWTIRNLKTLVGSGVVDKGEIQEPKTASLSSTSTTVFSPFFPPGLNIEEKEVNFYFSFYSSRIRRDFRAHDCPNQATSETKSLCTCFMLNVGLNRHPTSVRCYTEGALSLKVPMEHKSHAPEMLQEIKSRQIELGWFSSSSIAVTVSDEELKAGSSKYTYCDSLTINCEMTLHKVKNLKHKTDFSTSLAQHDLSTIMSEARREDLFCDLTIICGQKKFKAHRVVVGSQSAFFKVKLQRWETGDGTIDMSDLDPKIVETMIDYMYTGETSTVSDETYPDLLIACEKYQLSALKSVCEKVLVKNLTGSNALFMLKLASAYNADHLKQKAIDMINATPMTQEMIEVLANS